jgi:hypothetical protein
MGSVTKYRRKEAADLCKRHLREKYPDEPALVEEFIVAFEGKERDDARWIQEFADQRQVDDEMLQRVDAALGMWLNSN